MQPVTLKNNQFTDALYLAQGLLLLSILTMVVLSFSQSAYFLLTIPVLMWFFYRNHNNIQQNKQYSLVMNAECEWRLVNANDSKVTEAQLINYWQTPLFMVLHIQTQATNHHLLIFRKHIEHAAYSRLMQGVKKNESV